jgi:hypothetical protein
MSVPALPLGGCLFHHGGERDHDMFSLGTSILASIMFPSRTVILCQIVPPEINAKEKFLSATAHTVVETMDCLPVPGCPRDLDGPTKSSWTAIDWRPCGREFVNGDTTGRFWVTYGHSSLASFTQSHALLTCPGIRALRDICRQRGDTFHAKDCSHINEGASHEGCRYCQSTDERLKA